MSYPSMSNVISNDSFSELHILQMLNLSNCQNVTHTGLSSLTNGAQQLQQLILAYGSVVSLKLPKVISSY